MPPVSHPAGWAVLPMTDSDILQLSCCPAMASINLSDHDQIQDVGVAALAALPQLQAASISATGVTDAGLMLLSESTSLQRLDISRCALPAKVTPSMPGASLGPAC